MILNLRSLSVLLTLNHTKLLNRHRFLTLRYLLLLLHILFTFLILAFRWFLVNLGQSSGLELLLRLLTLVLIVMWELEWVRRVMWNGVLALGTATGVWVYLETSCVGCVFFHEVSLRKEIGRLLLHPWIESWLGLSLLGRLWSYVELLFKDLREYYLVERVAQVFSNLD